MRLKDELNLTYWASGFKKIKKTFNLTKYIFTMNYLHIISSILAVK